MFALTTVGCGDDAALDAGPLTMQQAAMLYNAPVGGGNVFACKNCHSLQEPSSDGIRKAGHEIGTASTRTSFKNGRLDNMLDAVNSCLTEWMSLPTESEWTTDKREWVGLSGFLDMMNPGSAADSISFSIIDPPTGAALDGGDAAAGETLFNTTCAECHGQDGVAGTGLGAPALDGAALATRPGGAAAFLAGKVRQSGRTSATYPELPEGNFIGGMPFWSEDRLSDGELRDIVAYVVTLDNPTAGTTVPATPPPAAEPPIEFGLAPMRTCASTHPSVGQVLTFSAPATYGVAGSAEIIDDCTIVLTGFGFNGRGGGSVEVYGGAGDPPNFNAGFALTADLMGTVFDDDTLTIQVPVGKTLDDVTGLSVWCSVFRVSFGSGVFAAAP